MKRSDDSPTTVHDVSNIVNNILNTVRPIRIGSPIEPSSNLVSFHLDEHEYEENGSTYLREKDVIIVGNKYTDYTGVAEIYVLFVGLNKDEKCFGLVKKNRICTTVPKGTYLQVIPLMKSLNDLFK